MFACARNDVTEIPTASALGLAILSAVLAASALLRLRRRSS